MSEADLRIEAMRRAVQAAEDRIEKQKREIMARAERRSSFSLAGQEARRASRSLPPEKEKARRASLGLGLGLDPHMMMDIEVGQAEPTEPTKWVIRTPLRVPYGKLRPTQGGYKSGWAGPLLPHLVQVPSSMMSAPGACRHSITRTTEGLMPHAEDAMGRPAAGGMEEEEAREAAGGEIDSWLALTKGIEEKAARHRGQGARGGGGPLRSQSQNEHPSQAVVLSKFVDYYGLAAMAAVEKKLSSQWGGGGFSPRFIQPPGKRPYARKALV